MRLTNAQERIVNLLDKRVVSPTQLTKDLGIKGYTVDKVCSMVLTLARKGALDNTKAALVLMGTEYAKFLSHKFGSTYTGMLITTDKQKAHYHKRTI